VVTVEQLHQDSSNHTISRRYLRESNQVQGKNCGTRRKTPGERVQGMKVVMEEMEAGFNEPLLAFS
jgi:hypothetical protein